MVLNQLVDGQWLGAQIGSSSSDGIARAMSEMIATNAIVVGARLPTVRELAIQLGTSAGTVSAAWNTLRAKGLIETRRRGGTVVSSPVPVMSSVESPVRPRSDSPDERWATVDLSRASADPDLQPDLGEALSAGLKVGHLHATNKDHMIAPLRAALVATWPYQAQAWTTAGGGTEGIMHALQAVTTPGDKVAIEDPTSPRLLGVLELLKLKAVPVKSDLQGPQVASLKSALAKKPAVFLYQLRAQVPTGSALSASRRDQLAELLKTHPDVTVIEDDHMGILTNTPAHSMGELLPERTVTGRGYCRAFGTDLRTSVLGGSARIIKEIEDFRSARVTMTSRIFQGALSFLLTDAGSVANLERTRARYAYRRQTLTKELQARGFKVEEGTGLTIWMPVKDETSALVNLASRGVILARGSNCCLTPAYPHLRITISRLPDGLEEIQELADLIAEGLAQPRSEDFD
ncbi:Transcriptional regulator, GntR family [Pseudomonas amygdali pv. eriobotryae]|uniref:Transcriptional regulator, GntR family n=2 Tax=Pseudomonas amygdali pv. eriobotryae TaxID=129137 RepID=A0A0P9U5A6_PSEA0|nr:Transcriptional regulator, GntR family [Pseudomonas amygdali pv. eriobotryae]RMM02419.1 Transcriptional regulator, GntR family [Pseudomonas amygdali pv. eriobotryae]RMO66778.1 Transcriptional regulator, GntR family [Pseudomonas amygdali pv. eriobotryae]